MRNNQSNKRSGRAGYNWEKISLQRSPLPLCRWICEPYRLSSVPRLRLISTLGQPTPPIEHRKQDTPAACPGNCYINNLEQSIIAWTIFRPKPGQPCARSKPFIQSLRSSASTEASECCHATPPFP